MLLLLVGPDRAALSKTIFQQIRLDAQRGISGQILIVPEQFSHEAERQLCQIGGDTISRYAEVLSFSRLSDRVASSCGGAAQVFLDKGGQLLTMAYAAEQVASRIKLFASVLRKPEFLSDLVRMISEFRSYCLEPSDLLNCARQSEGQFAQKLEELGLLYEAYLAACENGKADPGDKLIRLENALEEKAWAADKRIYVHGFSDYTAAELSVLEQLMSQSEQIMISVPDMSQFPSMAYLSKDTILTLQNLAVKNQIDCRLLREDHWIDRHPELQNLYQQLFQIGAVVPKASDSILLRSFDTMEQECQSAVLYVKSLLHRGERCRDISVACGDFPAYRNALRAALQAADVPAYFAGESDLLDHPVIHAVLSALRAVSGSMEYEDIMDYLKSWLPHLDREQCDRIDEYAYRWNLVGKQWEQPWELHPRGFGELWTEEDRQRLQDLNEVKQSALAPLLRLRKTLQQAQNTGEMIIGLHDLFEELSLRKRLEHRANALLAMGSGQQAQEISQIYEILCQSLEQAWMMIGQTIRTPDDFAKLYKLLLTQYKIGTIPAGLDQVYVSDLPDLRNKCSKHLVILGCNDGNLPAYRTSEGLLTEEERRQLSAQGISIAPSRSDQMDLEMERIAAVFAAPTHTFWLSSSGDQAAWLFRRAAAMYPTSFREEHAEVFLDLPSLAAWRLRHEDRSLLDIPMLDAVEASLRSLRSYRFDALQHSTVRNLYGREIYLSASRIDKYASCRFAFFLAYGLKAEPRKRAQMDPSVFGTFVHAVLEGVVQRVMEAEGFRAVSEQRLLEIALEEIDTYAQLHFPEQAHRAAYLFQRSRDEILEIVLDLGEELKNSLFQPVCCELEFSSQGLLPSIEIQGEDAVCRISGFVDRVDLFEDEDQTYVRVVDYKTGKKDFDYTDILNGAGLQMLVYLFALRQYGADLFRKASLEPAGVLYLPARKDYTLTHPLPDDTTVLQEHLEERRRKGLIRKDPNLLAAMEADPEAPRFMPYEAGKNGLKGDLADARQMILLERHVLRTLAKMTDQISGGDVTPNPVIRGQHSSCRFCDYASVCHKDLGTHQERVLAATSAQKFWEKLEQEEAANGGN